MRRTVTLPSINNVAVSNRFILECPVGMTYDVISLAYANVTLAQLTNITVKVNGKTVQEFASGTELDQLNTYYGRGAASGILNFWFVRPEEMTLQDQRITALGTADVKTLTVEGDIAAAATGVTLTASAIWSEPQPMGFITKIKSYPVTFSTSGQQDIDKIPLPNPRLGGRLLALHLGKADISATKVEINSRVAFEATKVLGSEYQTRYGRTPQTAAWTHVDFCLEGDLGQAIIPLGIQDFRIKPTLDTSGSVRVMAEYLDGYEGL